VLLYCGVCTGVRLLPPGENPIAVRNDDDDDDDDDNNNNQLVFFITETECLLHGTNYIFKYNYFFPVAQQPKLAPGSLLLEVS
jgi:hypothetical protein